MGCYKINNTDDDDNYTCYCDNSCEIIIYFILLPTIIISIIFVLHKYVLQRSIIYRRYSLVQRDNENIADRILPPPPDLLTPPSYDSINENR